MREDLLRKYSAKLGAINFRPKTGNGWLETKCILAPWTHVTGEDGSPSFAVHINDVGKSHFVCQSCKHKGSMSLLAYKLFGFTGEQEYQDIGREIEKIEIDSLANNLPSWDEEYDKAERIINRQFLNEGRAFRDYPPAFYFKPCLDYMRSRGIRPTTALKLNLRYHYNQSRLMFPIYDRNMELRGFSGRDMTGEAELKVKDFQGLNKVELFLGEDRVFRDRHKFKFVIIVEGLIDWAIVRQAGFENVMGLLGSVITKEKYEKLVDLDLPVVWFTDNDKAGRDCIYGPSDKETNERDEEKGALYMFRNYFPQMVAKYPKGKVTDPGGLNSKQIRGSISRAEYII